MATTTRDAEAAQATKRVTRLEVAGLCCQSEVKIVNKKLLRLPGVENLKVNTLTREVLNAGQAQQLLVDYFDL